MSNVFEDHKKIKIERKQPEKIVKDINNSSADHSKKYIQKEVPVTSIEMLPERLLLYTRKMSDVLKLLKNKETAASEENKFLVNARDTFNSINSKLSSKRDELSSVIQLDHNNQKSWRLPKTICGRSYWSVTALSPARSALMMPRSDS